MNNDQQLIAEQYRRIYLQIDEDFHDDAQKQNIEHEAESKRREAMSKGFIGFRDDAYTSAKLNGESDEHYKSRQRSLYDSLNPKQQEAINNVPRRSRLDEILFGIDDGGRYVAWTIREPYDEDSDWPVYYKMHSHDIQPKEIGQAEYRAIKK